MLRAVGGDLYPTCISVSGGFAGQRLSQQLGNNCVDTFGMLGGASLELFHQRVVKFACKRHQALLLVQAPLFAAVYFRRIFSRSAFCRGQFQAVSQFQGFVFFEISFFHVRVRYQFNSLLYAPDTGYAILSVRQRPRRRSANAAIVRPAGCDFRRPC